MADRLWHSVPTAARAPSAGAARDDCRHRKQLQHSTGGKDSRINRPRQDHRRIRRSDCSWRAFHDVAFYCCDLSPARMCQGRQGRTAQEGFTRAREEHLRRPIHGPLPSCKVRGADGRPRGIRFRPNRFGRSFGRKFGVLYDDYVNYRFVSGCAINKKDEEVVLHTQEAWGSSPYAPTIKINKLRTMLLTSYAPRRRSENRGQSNLWFTRPAASGQA